MIPKQLFAIVEADLQDLIAQRVEEGVTLEFKRDLPSDDRDSRKEFLADICSFANTKGGDITYGIDEDSEGRAGGLRPIVFNPDDCITKLSNIISDGLEPRLHGVTMAAISVATGGNLLVIRIPRSFSGIHRSARDGHFWIRESKSKRQLDVPGITARVAELLGREDRLQDFFARRYAAVGSNTYPLNLVAGPKLVVHMLPARDVLSGEELDLKPLLEAGRFPVLPVGMGSMVSHTFEGVLHHSPVQEGAVRAATMLFRSGVVEGVGAIVPRHAPADYVNLPLESIETACVEFLEKALPIASRLLFGGWPVTVRIAVVGADQRLGRSLNQELGWHFEELAVRVHTPVLTLPDLFIEEPPTSVPLMLRPQFDRLWQSWGYPRAYSFTERTDGLYWQKHKL